MRRTVGSARNAYLVAEQKDAFDIFGNYIATKMRGLNSSVDIEKIKILKTPLLQYSVLLFKKYTIFILSKKYCLIKITMPSETKYFAKVSFVSAAERLCFLGLGTPIF